ncbi:MAG: exodeoxyribonuclease VII large subunit, partial [Pseudomonadota bacterium]
ALMQQLEQLKKKLQLEGVFDSSHKQVIPKFPGRIGVITSATGSVIKDILHRLQDRYPIPVTLIPATVQGEAASKEVIAGIKLAEKLMTIKHKLAPDTLIIARGGGSFEDLWPFNNEQLIHTVFSCSMPTISAIGHETDITLLDLVADLRAPTPTAAAELATPEQAELNIKLQNMSSTISRNLPQMCNLAEQRLDLAWSKIISPSHYYMQQQQRLHNAVIKLPLLWQRYYANQHQRLHMANVKLSPRILDNYLQQLSQQLTNMYKLLQNLDVKQVLKRGFSIISTTKGDIVSSINQLENNKVYLAKFYDGDVKFNYNNAKNTNSKLSKTSVINNKISKHNDQLKMFD